MSSSHLRNQQNSTAEEIRAWAIEHGYTLGKRGLIPREITDAYRRAQLATSSEPASPLETQSLEPLVDYLEPQFGIVYEYDDLEKPAWNDALQQAVKRFLVENFSDDLFAKAYNYLDHLPPEGTRAEQAADITQHNLAFDIAMAVHNAVVESLPSLDALIGDLEDWSGHMELAYDAGTWLTANATEDQLAKLSRYLGTDPIEYELDRYALDGSLSPQRLLNAWHVFEEHPPVDLTDEEWQLLKPFIPENAFLRSSELQTRKAIDGMAYRFTYDVLWSDVPRRYGTRRSMYQRCYYTYRKGVFPRALAEFHDDPKATRLVEWLKTATA